MNFVITMEYTDGAEFKTRFTNFGDLSTYLVCRLDADINARKVKRITICPVQA